MNIATMTAMHIATQNACNTSIMAAANAAKSAGKRREPEPENVAITLLTIIGVLTGVLMAFFGFLLFM